MKQSARSPTAHKKTNSNSEQSPDPLRLHKNSYSEQYNNNPSQTKRRLNSNSLKKDSVQYYEQIELPILEKISKISAKTRSIMLDFLSETERNIRLNFTRIYPTKNSNVYDQFFESDRPVNKLVYKYLYQQGNEIQQLVDFSKFNDLAVPQMLHHHHLKMTK